MIFKKNKTLRDPKIGTKRVKIKFALFPTRLDNTDIVWLQKYKCHYEYRENVTKTDWIYGSGGIGGSRRGRTWKEDDWELYSKTI